MQPDYNMPFMKQQYFKEIFDNKRMSLKAANLSSSSEDSKSEKLATEDNCGEASEIDEDNFFSIQRKILKQDQNPELLKQLVVQQQNLVKDDYRRIDPRNRLNSDQVTSTEEN